MRSISRRFSAFVCLLLILTACSHRVTPTPRVTFTAEETTATYVAVDGFADGEVFVWFDENANGVVDNGEKPMPRVLVGIGYPNTFTDEDGRASVDEFMPGCGDDCWEGESAYIEVPQGFKATTSTELPLTGYGQTYEFGLTLDPTSATATPYTTSLLCKSYPSIEAEDMTVASDGTLWITFFESIGKYDPQMDEFTIFNAPLGFSDNIYANASNEIWIGSQEIEIGRYLNSEWKTYEADHLITGSDVSLGATSDGRVWFALQAPPDSLASFEPSKGQWAFYVQAPHLGYAIGKEVRAATDGSFWFAAFDYRAELPPPVSDEEIQWQVFDLHAFTKEEIHEIPNLGWIEDSQMAPDGTIWLATSNGLAQFNPFANTWNVHEWPHTEEIWPIVDTSSLALSPDGSVWVGMSSNQRPLALQWLPGEELWRTYDDRDGIPNVEIEHIALTPDGKVWFGFGMDFVTGCNVMK